MSKTKTIAVLATVNNYDWFIKNIPDAKIEALRKQGYEFYPVEPTSGLLFKGERPAAYTHVLGSELTGYEQAKEYFSSYKCLYVPHTKFINLPTHVLLTIIGN